MRILLPVSVFFWGCAETCPTPQAELNGALFSVFLTPLTYDLENPDAFPGDTSPANGAHTYQFDWASNAADSVIAVTIDGQPFEGEGSWNEVECGNFTAKFNGGFVGEDGSSHAFAAFARLAAYQGQVNGFLDWAESWSIDAEVGTFTTIAQVLPAQP